jgi:hypothetical protein
MKIEIPSLQVIDRLSGVTPTIAGWDTDPTDLANSTDGDFDTATGTGINTAVAAYADGGGSIKFDLGAVYNVAILGKILIGNTLVGGGLVGCRLSVSEDDITYIPCVSNNMWVVNWATNETVVLFPCMVLARCRYISLYVNNAAAAQTDIKLGIYELKALDFNI